MKVKNLTSYTVFEIVLMVLMILHDIHQAWGIKEHWYFPLPILPDATYDIHDVMVLPDNQNIAEVTLMDAPSNTTLFTVNVTPHVSFYLQCAECRNTSVKPGMILVTPIDTSVYVNLHPAANMLQLPPLQDFGDKFFISVTENDLQESTIVNLLLYPSTNDTSITMCSNQSSADDLLTNFAPKLTVVPQVINCFQMKISHYEGLVLNNISLLQGMEIRTNHPVGILKKHYANASVNSTNGLLSLTSKGQITPIIWNIYPPVNVWRKQFIIVPLGQENEFKLCITSSADAVLSVSTPKNETSFSLTKYETKNLTVHINSSLFIHSSETFLLSCIDDYANLCLYTRGIDIQQFQLTVLNNNEVKSTEFRWVYLESESEDIILVCSQETNVSFTTLNGTQEFPNSVNIQTNNKTDPDIHITSFTGLKVGLHKMYIDTSFGVCDCFNDKRTQNPAAKDVATKITKYVVIGLNYANVTGTENIHQNASTNTKGTNKSAEIIGIEVNNVSDKSIFGSDKGLIDNTTATTSNEFDQSLIVPNLENSNDGLQLSNWNGSYQEGLGNISKSDDQNINNDNERTDSIIVQGYKGANEQLQNETEMYTVNTNTSSGAHLTEQLMLSESRSKTILSNIFLHQNQSSSKLEKSLPIIEQIKKQPKSTKQLTQINTKDPYSNEMFKTILEIVHTKDGQVRTVNRSGKSTIHVIEHPGYVLRPESDEGYYGISDGKSLLAIIISLSAALFAVVAIILIFFLIEFFSRRKQIRNTRIRPFVSYY